MSSIQLFPEVKDASTLGAKFSQNAMLGVGVEGQAAAPGTGVLTQVYRIVRPSEAVTLFGTSSPLTQRVNQLLSAGIPTVYATASKLTTTPSLAERQAAWANLESDVRVRIRLTDSELQADHVALGTSCNNASLIQNKQFGMVGLASGTAKAALIAAAAAIASKRICLVAPGVYDETGVLRGGSFAATAVAAEVAKNLDLSDDLDTFVVPNLTGIEIDGIGQPIFRNKVVSGTAINDFEDLLQGGVSPLMPGRTGGVSISHLRTTYTADTTMDALMTRLITDQIFVLIREYAYEFNYLRKGNTSGNRELLRSGVEALLTENADLIMPVAQPNGKPGYGVAVTASSDNRQMIVSYKGEVVRGVQTILVDGQLIIAV